MGNARFEWRAPFEPYYVVKITPSTETPVVRFQNVLEAMKEAFEGSTDRAIVQLFDIVTNQFGYEVHRKAADKSSVYMPYGRQFYKPLNPKQDLGMGRIAYDGFFKSVRMVMGDPNAEPQVCLNVDAKKAPFYKAQPLLDTVRETLGMANIPSAPLNHNQVKLLGHHLKELKVMNEDTGRTYTITYISEKNAREFKFNAGDREINIVEFNAERHNRILLHPHLPCVISKLPSGDVCFPMEVLHVLPNQKVDLKKSTPMQSQQLIRLSGVPPSQRRNEILQKLQFCGAGPNDPFCQEFGIERSPQMMKVTGRVLNAPRVEIGAKQRLPVVRGQWDPFRGRLYMATNIKKWAAIACFEVTGGSQLDQSLRSFCTGLSRACRSLGLGMPETPCDMRAVPRNGIENYFKICAKEGVDCVVCFIEANDAATRNLIKYYGDVEFGLVTQCIQKETAVRKAQPATFNNIVLKLNAKNGGVNNAVDDHDPLVSDWVKDNSGVMYLGFDVNHPPALSRAEIRQGIIPKEPSVVGAIANTNASVADYSMLYYLQDSRQERIDDDVMADCIASFINMYRKNHSNNLPERIVVFRDGVSESQYDMVLHQEVYALKEALWRAGCNNNPPVTMIVCQKRHHTRFFPENMDRNSKPVQQNIPAGTVVDTGPVSISLFDFYLASHAGIQGTTKATKYVVLRDENNFTADSLQRLTYVLAHVYQRCAKSVSLPAPVYFAHHAATRGKELYDAVARGGREESSSGVSSGSGASSTGDQSFAEIQERIQRPTNMNFAKMTSL